MSIASVFTRPTCSLWICPAPQVKRIAHNGYSYIVKFRLGLDDVVRTAVEMIVFEESSRMDRKLDGVRITFKGLASSSDAFLGRLSKQRD